ASTELLPQARRVYRLTRSGLLRDTRVRRRVLALLLLALVAAAAAAQTAAERDQSREIFNEIGGILRDLRDITGFKIHHTVPAEIISRDKVKEFLQKRMKEVA